MKRFDLIFITDAISFIIAAVIFYFIPMLPQKLENQVQKINLGIRSISEMAKTFILLPFAWVLLSAFAIGSFMTMEYPLITTELGLSPKLMFFIYAGHIIGSLVARKIAVNFLNWKTLEGLLIVASIAMITAFGMVGVFGNWLVLVSLQMGIVAYFMVTSEVIVNYHLMAKSGQDIYPRNNLYYRISNRFTYFLGALTLLVLFSKFSLFKTNIIVNCSLIIFGCIISILFYLNPVKKEYSHETQA